MSRSLRENTTATAFTFWELFKSHVTFLFIISLHDVPKGDNPSGKRGRNKLNPTKIGISSPFFPLGFPLWTPSS